MARDAMTKGAQLRMANASFPHELRLQVMKASLRCHASTFNISSTASSDTFTSNLKDAVTSLLDTQHTSDAICDTLKELAEQAFFETAIFKVNTSISFSRYRDGKMYEIPPLFYEIAERVQHIELTIGILPELDWESTLKNAAKLWTSLRLNCPKLKACVFTVVVRFMNENWLFGYVNGSDNAPFPKEILREGKLHGECLGNTLTKLFAEFAEKGPGVRRFVRVQHLQCDPSTKSATPHYGPLVAIHSAQSEAGALEDPGGVSMLTGAYQFARIGGKVRHTISAEY